MMQYQDKLLYQGALWNEVIVQNDKLLVTSIDDFSSYIPMTNPDDFVVNVLSFKDKGFNNETQRPEGDNYITIDINKGQKGLTKRVSLKKRSLMMNGAAHTCFIRSQSLFQ